MASEKTYFQDSSGRLTFADDKIPAGMYKNLCRNIVENFKLKPAGEAVSNGYDVMFRDYVSDNQMIGLEWDS